MKKSIIFGISALLSATALADVTVSGTICDAYTQQPLAGVYVQAFSDSKITAMTDSTGTYRLTVPDYVKSLRVVRAGYNAQQVPLGGRESEVNAELYPATFRDAVGLANSAIATLNAQANDLTSDVSIDNQIINNMNGQIRTVNRGGTELFLRLKQMCY